MFGSVTQPENQLWDQRYFSCTKDAMQMQMVLLDIRLTDFLCEESE